MSAVGGSGASRLSAVPARERRGTPDHRRAGRRPDDRDQVGGAPRRATHPPGRREWSRLVGDDRRGYRPDVGRRRRGRVRLRAVRCLHRALIAGTARVDMPQRDRVPEEPRGRLQTPIRRILTSAFRRDPVPADRQAIAVQHSGMTNDAIVYVVDDDASVCRALARLFRTVGWLAEPFPSAKAFLSHPVQPRPMCLVLDIRLPGASGLDLQDALAEAGRDIPIVFITGHGDVPTTVRAMKAGAVDFLQKPFNDQDLLDCVQRALAHSRERLAAQIERTELQTRLETLTPREREVLLQVI